MRPFLEGGVGNPAALHSHGLEARASLDGARAKVARLVGGAAAGVIFTASATEANNLAIKGVARRARGRHIVASAIEHVSVVNPCRDLEKQGWSVTWLPVDRDGVVDPEAAARALRDDTALLSIMAANDEIGALQPVRELGRLARARGVPFHVDGVGAAGRLPLSVDECAIDLLALSSNDLCGPPGGGALWVRSEVALAPLVLGGGQEGGYRSGTENLPAIVGMGVAADLARSERAGDVARLAPLRDRLLDGLLERIEQARVTGPRGPHRLPHHASIVVPQLRKSGVHRRRRAVCHSRDDRPGRGMAARHVPIHAIGLGSSPDRRRTRWQHVERVGAVHLSLRGLPQRAWHARRRQLHLFAVLGTPGPVQQRLLPRSQAFGWLVQARVGDMGAR
jgi:cysteine desulfurase